MVASETPVTPNVARPRKEIGWLIEASESTEGEGRGDSHVIDTDERGKEDRSERRLEDRILKQ